MKKRADVLLFEKGIATSRQRAQAMIMSGEVFVNNIRVPKPSTLLDEETEFEIKQGLKYVSRGGLKLEKAINVFKIDLHEKTCVDIGASTGGFTDCMLQNGAKKVYAVDVGYGQLDWSLRNNPKVVVKERTNARYLQKQDFNERIDFVSVDASFISLSLLFPAIDTIMDENGTCLTLIKPQFEAGKGKVGKNGVVRNRKVHQEVIENTISFAKTNHFNLLNLDYSPITGPKGNIEFLAYWDRHISSTDNDKTFLKIDEVIQNAYLFHNMNFE